MSMGERTPIAVLDAAASGRMAVGEALTNVAAASIAQIGDIKLSANWMAACGHDGEDARLFDTVKAVGMELCPALGISIPVGKDSLSMKSVWQDRDQHHEMISPLSLIVSAFAPVTDVRQTLTPGLQLDQGDSDLILLDLGDGQQRLGGSALAQVYGKTGDIVPDVDDPAILKAFFNAIQSLNHDGLLLAYHDRSDGGLFTSLVEMAFAARCGLKIHLETMGDAILPSLFNEELGAVIQIKRSDRERVLSSLSNAGLAHISQIIGHPTEHRHIIFNHHSKPVFESSLQALQQRWSETSFKMQSLRDHPDCAAEAFASISNTSNSGLFAALSFDPNDDICAPLMHQPRPKMAVLREQGVNGQVEMAAAFDRAGFDCVDVHMSDIIAGDIQLNDFQGLVACGGFSFGDVLGAGRGWALSVLHNERARQQFNDFFQRPDTFALGVCNGCQMMSGLKDMIPGAEHWPSFERNRSEQFEARLLQVEVLDSPSIFLSGMVGSKLPLVIAHGEGRVVFDSDTQQQQALGALRYLGADGQAATSYPHNPNGSPDALTAFTTSDGRFTIMMPHPERLFRSSQYSWHPATWGEDGPWLRMFRNARLWVANQSRSLPDS